MSKTTRARYTLEFKLEAVRLVKAGQSVAAVAATMLNGSSPTTLVQLAGSARSRPFAS